MGCQVQSKSLVKSQRKKKTRMLHENRTRQRTMLCEKDKEHGHSSCRLKLGSPPIFKKAAHHLLAESTTHSKVFALPTLLCPVLHGTHTPSCEGSTARVGRAQAESQPGILHVIHTCKD